MFLNLLLLVFLLFLSISLVKVIRTRVIDLGADALSPRFDREPLSYLVVLCFTLVFGFVCLPGYARMHGFSVLLTAQYCM